MLFVIFLRETRGTVILSRKAARLRKETGDDRYQCRADAERASLVTLVKVSLIRPLWFLATEPVVMALTAWISLSWGVMCVGGFVDFHADGAGGVCSRRSATS